MKKRRSISVAGSLATVGLPASYAGMYLWATLPYRSKDLVQFSKEYSKAAENFVTAYGKFLKDIRAKYPNVRYWKYPFERDLDLFKGTTKWMKRGFANRVEKTIKASYGLEALARKMTKDFASLADQIPKKEIQPRALGLELYGRHLEKLTKDFGIRVPLGVFEEVQRRRRVVRPIERYILLPLLGAIVLKDLFKKRNK